MNVIEKTGECSTARATDGVCEAHYKQYLEFLRAGRERLAELIDEGKRAGKLPWPEYLVGWKDCEGIR